MSSGFLYAIKFSNGVIKVGSTRTPQARLRTHAGEAAGFGHQVLDQWLSDEHDGYQSTEQTLIAQMTFLACQRHRREYFQHVNWDQVLRVAKTVVANHVAGRWTTVPLEHGRFTMADVAAMHPQFERSYLHQGCIYDQFARSIDRREFVMSPAQIKTLLDMHADLPGPFTGTPSASLRHRMERRAAA
ncbi:hypothetical protein ACWT_5655 [Actinoplanes sp. SE50]|uniref:GIY-YIG nuclease family protein n=1 Tax=unclassified Actinoplanes TaxID=2626549 RepID=UPI00023ED2B6|nr:MULTISPECIES: GIY-YIG nuclease family protein [unclassified Actinoplanes]AEV86672.1 hypothetical protein ACPL_5785 [Actinoplanes sp. SE50/110]ATO85070.1 hypothetical protein ACWT_5655 [Actinoplanes sp. SE50]SLM02481.1 hypothetical protein ACSP50_5731 [Actinoplanes sp. SE50/110]